MNKYIIIRYDNKSISPPMSKHEAIAKLNEYIDINDSPNSNQYFTKQ